VTQVARNGQIFEADDCAVWGNTALNCVASVGEWAKCEAGQYAATGAGF